MNVSDTQMLIEFLNSSGGIPLQIVQTSNWSQFAISVIVTLVSSIFLFLILGEPLIQKYKEARMIMKFKKVYKKTGKHFLVLKNGNSGGLFSVKDAMIDRDMHLKVAQKLQEFKGEDVDVYLHTPGGEIFATQAISRLFQNYPGKIRAIIPLFAMSGGTYLTLSCDEIYMANTSCLGPIDPQLGNLFKYGSARSWKEIVKMKGKKAEDSSISFALTGAQYTKTIRKQLNNLLKDKVPNLKTRNALAKALTDGQVEHGLPLTKEDLRELGLDVQNMLPGMNFIGQILIKSKTTGVYGK